jgi:hypothetical protein
MATRFERRHQQAQRHVSALRAFHTGLIAETHRHLHVLMEVARHIDALRKPTVPPEAKLAAANASARQLTKLKRLKQPWCETYLDLLRSLQRVRSVYRDIVKKAGSSQRT